jgi:hypothetical protein
MRKRRVREYRSALCRNGFDRTGKQSRTAKSAGDDINPFLN